MVRVRKSGSSAENNQGCGLYCDTYLLLTASTLVLGPFLIKKELTVIDLSLQLLDFLLQPATGLLRCLQALPFLLQHSLFKF